MARQPLVRDQQRADQLDGIVVETSGLALPEPLVAAFGWPEIRTRTRVNAVVAVVDVAASAVVGVAGLAVDAVVGTAKIGGKIAAKGRGAGVNLRGGGQKVPFRVGLAHP